MMNRLLLGLMLSMTLLSAGCHAEPAKQTQAATTTDWKTECVGRYQVAVPGNMEVALTIPEKLFKPNDVVNEYRFNDGGVASFSGISTEYGGAFVTKPLNKEKYIDLKSEISDQLKQRKEELIQQGENKSADSITVQSFNSRFSKNFSWISKSGAMIFVQDNDGRIFEQFGIKENQTGEEIVRAFLTHFHPRALFEIPKQPGVCFPYGFIADDGKAPRNVAVTMRLVDHPDVEVFFKDSSYPLTAVESQTPKQIIETFWEFGNRQVIKQAKMDWRGYRSIKIDNRDGTGLFVTLTRYDHSTYHGDEAMAMGAPADGSTDYGYVAVVKGDSKAQEAPPT
ncbi:T6SS immunity protein Tli4 family protein [Sulfuriferula nivalis]|uniref:Tle cognate immunity protein 4 C-terminal domain-containing protein n=1 Tax=Sulfuriferula nivalis TaxID=2675298 RepID=A0A809RJY5_9PROT|nr:T6SS immunity protein Tli4 family protein [Sulfuriferula nivalis]BBP02249.1 hypothetical protein SFSGTM_29570 [Sulfuriferula nivalis]